MTGPEMRHTIGRRPEQLDAILREGSGSLVETPYAILLLALARGGARAVLTLHRDPLQKEIVFDAGSPVDCESNIATETLGRYLVAAGRLAAHDAHAAEALAVSRGTALEEILIEQRLLERSELDRLRQQSLGRRLLEPFSWKSGSFEISYDVPPVDASLRVKVPQLVLTGILKVESQEVVDDALAAFADRHLALAAEPPFELSEIRLSADQQKIVDAARMTATVSDAIARAGIAEEDARRIVYALLLLGAITATEAPQVAMPRFELDHPFAGAALLPDIELPEERPPAPKPEPPPPAAATGAATREEVLAAHAAHRNQDAFALLGVSENDGPLQFTRAFVAVADKFLPTKFDERTPDGLREKAQDVFLAAARAWADLADPVRREALRTARTQKAEPAPPPAIPVAQPPAPATAPPPKPAPRKPMKAAIIDPEELCRSGRELAQQGKLREALSSFELAAQCDAQNGTYAAEVAWCRFQLHVSPATTTLRMLKDAIRIDPRSGLAHLYAAKVATAMGNRAEASNLLDRAAMLMPRDLRVVEALKALRS